MADNYGLAMLARLFATQQGQAYLDKGYGNAQGQFKTNYYDPYSKFGNQSLGMLGNALGLNGAGGSAAAQKAFQTGPGYQFAMDQGLQGLDRSAAARGMLQSGNADADRMRFGQGLANQEWGNWLSRIGGGAQLGLSAAQGQTGRQGMRAGYDMQYGLGGANLWNDFGKGLSEMMTDQGKFEYQKSQQNQQNLFGGILGGLNLAGGVFKGFA